MPVAQYTEVTSSSSGLSAGEVTPSFGLIARKSRHVSKSGPERCGTRTAIRRRRALAGYWPRQEQPDRSKKLERFLPTSDRLSRKRGVVSAWARGLRRLEQLRRDEKRPAGRLGQFFDPVSGVDRVADDCEF